MKKTGIILSLFFVLLFSCRYQDPQHPNFVTAQGLNNSFTSSGWHIASYIKDGKETAGSFKDYTIYFHSDNVVIINHKRHDYIGKWSVSSDYGTDDSPPADVGFTIAFKTEDSLPLDGNYDIIERTATKLLLRNTAGNSDNSADLIEFKLSKNSNN